MVGVKAEACSAARCKGNQAYAAGELALAAEHYLRALELWEEAVEAEPAARSLEVGQHVRYHKRGYFGIVMSCFPLFDEYFLKDLGSDQAIWVGDAGGSLRRFNRDEVLPVSRELIDLRLAVLQNMAAVSLKRELWDETVSWADHALWICGRSPKALMRKGSALLRLNQPGPASDVLATAKQEVPGDKEVSRLLREAEKRRAPTWVCVTGCCGPWGIVCGGPVADKMAQVVPPARKRAEVQDDAALPEAPEGGEPAQDPADEREEVADDGCSTCSSSSGLSSQRPASKVPDAWEMINLVPSVPVADKAAGEAAPAATEVAAAVAEAAVLKAGGAGLGAVEGWWIAIAVLLPAAMAAVWMLGVPELSAAA